MQARTHRLLAAATRIETAAAVLARVLAFAAAAAVAAIMTLLVVSTIRRYALGTPVPQTEELGSLLFLAVCLLSIPYGFARGRHVRIDFVSRFLPPRWRLAFEAAGLMLGALALLILVRETWDLTVFSFEIGARSDMSELALWPWRFVLPLGLGLFTAAITLRALVIALRLIGRTPVEPVSGEAGLPLH